MAALEYTPTVIGYPITFLSNAALYGLWRAWLVRLVFFGDGCVGTGFPVLRCVDHSPTFFQYFSLSYLGFGCCG